MWGLVPLDDRHGRPYAPSWIVLAAGIILLIVGALTWLGEGLLSAL
jgi:hypothetical protein